jgi:hypothetical protein
VVDPCTVDLEKAVGWLGVHGHHTLSRLASAVLMPLPWLHHAIQGRSAHLWRTLFTGVRGETV